MLLTVFKRYTRTIHLAPEGVIGPTLCGREVKSWEWLVLKDAEPTCTKCIKSAAKDEEVAG